MAAGRATLADLIELRTRLREDASASPQALRQRDAQIARDDRARATTEVQLLSWLAHTRTPASAQIAARSAAAHRLIRLGLVVLGLVLGAGAAGGIFYYDGSHPVNVLYALGVLVGLNWALLLVWIVAMLPAGVRRWIPGLDAILDALTILSPGKWVMAAGRWLPQAYRETLLAGGGAVRAGQGRFGRVSKWTAAEGSQVFAIAFYTAAAVVFIGLIAFKDMAFAWSTTLNVPPQQLADWMKTVAQPWGWAWPEAMPDAPLIEQTQYYRWHEVAGTLPSGGDASSTDPRRFGQWWPFMLMCLSVYGLLPRMVTWVIARQRLGAAISGAFIHGPDVRTVLARLGGPAVRSDGQGEEAAPGDGDQSAPLHTAPTAVAGAVVIDWADAAGESSGAREALIRRLGLTSAIHEAGGARSTRQDAALIESIGDMNPSSILVLVKAWEPPMGEIADFLIALRRAVGVDTPIEVAPLVMDAAGRVGRPDEADVTQWRGSLGRVGDPQLAVVSLFGEGA